MWRKGRKARTKPQVSNMHGFPQLEGRLISLECTKHSPAASPATPHTIHFKFSQVKNFLAFSVNWTPHLNTHFQTHNADTLLHKCMMRITWKKDSPWALWLKQELPPAAHYPDLYIPSMTNLQKQLCAPLMQGCSWLWNRQDPKKIPNNPYNATQTLADESLPLYCASKVRLTDSAVIYKYCWAGAVFFRKLPRRNLGKKKIKENKKKRTEKYSRRRILWAFF